MKKYFLVLCLLLVIGITSVKPIGKPVPGSQRPPSCFLNYSNGKVKTCCTVCTF